MAYIPYGYEIKDGHISVNPEKKEHLIHFFERYLAGDIIKDAGADLPMAASSCARLLDNSIYTGDGPYPRIISDNMYQEIQAVRKERKQGAPHAGHYRKVMPIFTDFVWIAAAEDNIMDGTEQTSIQDLYNCIVPVVKKKFEGPEVIAAV